MTKSGKLFFSGRSFLEGKIHIFDLKVLFSKNLSEWLFLKVICVKFKVDGTKVVSVFEFGLFLSFFGVFT